MAAARPIEPGTFVRIDGLASRADLNGTCAAAVSFDAQKGRWNVLLYLSCTGERREHLALKEENLTASAEHGGNMVSLEKQSCALFNAVGACFEQHHGHQKRYAPRARYEGLLRQAEALHAALPPRLAYRASYILAAAAQALGEHDEHAALEKNPRAQGKLVPTESAELASACTLYARNLELVRALHAASEVPAQEVCNGLNNLALAYKCRGDFYRAVRLYQEAIDTMPHDQQKRDNFQTLQAHLNQPLDSPLGKGLRVLTRQRGADVAEDCRAEGNAAFRTGRHSAAVRWYSTALEAAADDSPPTERARLLSNRAAAYAALADHAEAEEDARACTELDPTFAKGWFRLGKLRARKIGEAAQAEAIGALRKAEELAPGDAAVLSLIAELEKVAAGPAKEKVHGKIMTKWYASPHGRLDRLVGTHGREAVAPAGSYLATFDAALCGWHDGVRSCLQFKEIGANDARCEPAGAPLEGGGPPCPRTMFLSRADVPVTDNGAFMIGTARELSDALWSCDYSWAACQMGGLYVDGAPQRAQAIGLSLAGYLTWASHNWRLYGLLEKEATAAEAVRWVTTIDPHAPSERMRLEALLRNGALGIHVTEVDAQKQGADAWRAMRPRLLEAQRTLEVVQQAAGRLVLSEIGGQQRTRSALGASARKEAVAILRRLGDDGLADAIASVGPALALLRTFQGEAGAGVAEEAKYMAGMWPEEPCMLNLLAWAEFEAAGASEAPRARFSAAYEHYRHAAELARKTPPARGAPCRLALGRLLWEAANALALAGGHLEDLSQGVRVSELRELATEAAAADAELRGIFAHMHELKGGTQAQVAVLAALEAQREVMGDARLTADEFRRASKNVSVSAVTAGGEDAEQLAAERMRGPGLVGPMWTAGRPRAAACD